MQCRLSSLRISVALCLKNSVRKTLRLLPYSASSERNATRNHRYSFPVNHAQPDRRPLAVTLPGIIGSLLVLVVAAVCVRLGFWQLDRLEQRQQRNALVEVRMQEPPLALDGRLRDTAGVFYRRASVRGRLDYRRSIVLAGRSLRGAPGVHLLTPVLLNDGSAVLVNRGWVPSPDGASIDFAAFDGPAEIDDAGLVLPLPGVGAPRAESPPGEEFQRVWFRIDPAALARQYPYTLALYQVQLLGSGQPVGGPRRLDPPALDSGPHLGYALQWFSFAAIAIIGWIALVLHRTSPRPRTPTRGPENATH